MKKTNAAKQWNISLLALFVLTLGALIWLISTWFIQNMVKSNAQIRDFYQAYYLAKWGIELWTIAVKSYEHWFETQLSGSEDIIRNNLKCKDNCSIELSITSRIKSDRKLLINSAGEIIDSCSPTTKDKFILRPGQSQIFPLYADNRTLQTSADKFINLLSDKPPYRLAINSFGENQTTSIGIGVVLWSANQEEYNKLPLNAQQRLFLTWTIADGLNIYTFLTVGKSINPRLWFGWRSIASQYTTPPTSKDDKYFNYFYITNVSENNDFEYCLEIHPSQHGFVNDKSIVNAIAQFRTTTLWIQALINKPLIEYIVRPTTRI